MMSVKRRVVVTGLGLCTPLGVGVQRVWNRILEGCSGIQSLPDEETYESITSRVVGLVPRGSGEGEFDEESITSSSERRTMTLSTMFALCAAEEALSDSKWSPQTNNDRIDTGVSIGTCLPDVEIIVEAGNATRAGKTRLISPYFIPKILTNLVAGHVSIRYGFKGPNHCVSTACATGLHSIGDAAAMIARGATEVMVAGGTEAAGTHPLAFAGFSRAKALSTKFNSTPQLASRPFDAKRDGFVMSEGCGLVVLEELEHALKRDAKIYAEILGYGLMSDAHHITAPHDLGEGAINAMKMALRDAGIKPNAIGHINAHATSTPLGDAVENDAIKKVFGGHSKNLLISACKGALGHMQGAAGSVEAILTILSVASGVCPPTLNITELTKEFDLNYCSGSPVAWDGEDRRIAIKNSFGFGGTNASLCIGEYKQF